MYEYIDQLGDPSKRESEIEITAEARPLEGKGGTSIHIGQWK
jgi:hypothetical protein